MYNTPFSVNVFLGEISSNTYSAPHKLIAAHGLAFRVRYDCSIFATWVQISSTNVCPWNVDKSQTGNRNQNIDCFYRLKRCVNGLYIRYTPPENQHICWHPHSRPGCRQKRIYCPILYVSVCACVCVSVTKPQGSWNPALLAHYFKLANRQQHNFTIVS